MPSIRRIKSAKGVKFQVYVRREKVSLSRVFWKKPDAERWGRSVEDAIASATKKAPFDAKVWMNEEEEKDVDDSAPHPWWTLRQALELYRDTVTPGKKGHVQERKRITQWLARPLAGKALNAITADDLQKHVDDRTTQGRASATIRNEVLLISAVFRHAIERWKIDLTNPVTRVRLPSLPAGRQARLEEARDGTKKGDEQRIVIACLRVGGPAFANLTTFAIETGMRQGEILSLTKNHVKVRDGVTVVELSDSKNGHRRSIVMSETAIGILRELSKDAYPMTRLFPFNEHSLRHVWKKARDLAGLPALRFHDLRHEAISRMASMGLNIGQLQAQSGHRTAQVLLRYVNARPSDIARLMKQ